VARILAIATVIGLAAAVGALPVLSMGKFSRRLYDATLGVAAGLMLSAATLGLLAHATQIDPGPHGLAPVVLGFLVGIGVLLALERFLPHRHAGGHRDHLDEPGGADADASPDEAKRQGLLMAGAMTLHRIPEGLAIGAGFASGAASLGWLLAIAIGFQNLCEGAVTAAPLGRAGVARGRAFAIVLSTGLVVPFAAAIGALVGRASESALPFLLSLAAGAIVYLTSSEIIPESHSHGNESAASIGLVAGFLVTLVIRAFVGH
jgi:zinc transporter, ZIP family